MKLEEYRDKLDGIDKELSRLFAERMEICARIGELKKEKSLPVRDTDREKSVIAKVTANVPDEYKNCTAELYEKIFQISRDYQSGGKTDE